MKEKKEEEMDLLDNFDYMYRSASATDCTGLIPRPPLSEAESDSYEELYHYQADVQAEVEDDK